MATRAPLPETWKRRTLYPLIERATHGNKHWHLQGDEYQNEIRLLCTIVSYGVLVRNQITMCSYIYICKCIRDTMQTPPCASLSTLKTERPYQMSVFLWCSHKTHIINAKYCAAVNEKREPSQKDKRCGPSYMGP